ncbi:hypothetical protein INT46_003702 [Mucor plumbeus]|uniref:Transposase n=1 Tax=Mucor plumbeus TaxID=97098 RepID=A0A8H7VAN4_9FUNG|nr:hypothetical protein INT46_003702 [Mucor plumbeus]
MVHPLPVELQNSIKSLLLQNTPFYIIRKDYPPVLLSTLTHYKKKLLSSATLLAGRRPSFVSVSTRQYIAKMLRNGKQNGPKTFQEYLRLIEIDVSMSVVRNLLKRMDFKQRRKIKTNFISKKKQSSSAGMGQKTPASYDGNTYYWSDGRDILQTSLLDTLEYYDMNRNVIRFQQDNATPHTSGITQVWFSAKGFIFETIKKLTSSESRLEPNLTLLVPVKS